MDRIRMSLRVCQIRLRKTFTTPRFYVALLWIAILFHVMTVGIRGFCEQTGVDVTFWMLPFMTRYNDVGVKTINKFNPIPYSTLKNSYFVVYRRGLGNI